MIKAFFQSFFMIMLTEIGSADQMVLAAIASHSKYPFVCWLGAVLSTSICFFVMLYASHLIQKLPVSMNLISGVIMISTGIVLLWKS